MAITVSEPQASQPVCIIAMGVSGTGKSTLGAALAHALQMPYIDGDDLHPAANVEKMARGEPLVDADRAPWLRRIRGEAVRVAGEQRSGAKLANGAGAGAGAGVRPGMVIACSALKRAYRDVLRGGSGADSMGNSGDTDSTDSADRDSSSTSDDSAPLPTYFVFIEGSREVLMERMLNRSGHFMKAGMLDSQLNTLESPAGEEGVVVVSVEEPTPKQVEKAMAGLKALWAL
ncbi:P-loop containing nucleoside triphosphate hydrolase protein [Mycena filopes]|nr:P-loop containing nucleoside triphosphate hydrolase protein [Mycena filopes]